MSSNEDKIKKKLQDERLKQEALGREIEKIRLEEEKRKNATLLDEQSPKSQPVEEMTQFSLQPTGVETDDWKKIVEDFKKKYPNSPIENNKLIFPTKDDAIVFFTAQATQEPPRKFLAFELDSNGKPTGFYAFSCGNGTLFQGTLNEIEEQLKSEQENNPDDPNLKQGLAIISRFLNPAKNYRETLIQAKEPEGNDLNAGQQAGHGSLSPQRTKS